MFIGYFMKLFQDSWAAYFRYGCSHVFIVYVYTEWKNIVQTFGLCLVYFHQGDPRSSMNESSSLLGGSPRRQCGRKGSPYHTGQLHPAVRVADLLQHINQMKTAEGYGFKQEYEVGFILF